MPNKPPKKKKRKIKVKKKAVLKRKREAPSVNIDSLGQAPVVVPNNGPTFRIKVRRK